MYGKVDITKAEGRTFIPGFLWECVEYARNEWDMPQNSVIISSYLKTGESESTFFEYSDVL